MVRTAEYEVLQQPDIYPEATSKVKVYETHISWVYLTDHYVYKIKKPLDLGFLDFSTLAQRQFFCEQVVAVNRRLSADVYLDVIPLYQSDDQVNFAGDGAVVDYAVKMRRLSEECALHTMLRRGPLSETLMTALAERLAAFHRDHPLPASEEAYGTLDLVRADWEENFVQTTDYIGQTLSQDAFDRIQYAVNSFMSHHASWFAQRVEATRIRDGHGDLRAEHIYFDQGAFQIIDCIEFNHRFRYIDVASEVAFLAMDLDRLGAPDEARQFVQAYVRASGDAELYRLLEFYCCYRAYVRGKVTSMRLQTAPPDERGILRRRAETYFNKAAGYASRLMQPLLLFTTGLIGTGKSTVANHMATVLDLDVFSSDRVRKKLAGASSQSSPGAGYGQGSYDSDAKRQTYETMTELARHSLVQGQSVLLDASSAKRAERQRAIALAHNVGARVCLLECQAPEPVLRTRLKAREEAAETISDARENILSDFQRDYEPVLEDEWTCHVRLDTTQGVESCVQQALAMMYGS
jgi:aminoglycoside phosphotransferase family enzyme/predicted kinase